MNMKINLLSFDKELEKPVEIISKKLGVELGEGIDVIVEKSDKLNICYDGEKGKICYITKASFFRMFTLFVKKIKSDGTFDYSEEILIDKCGVMLDMSRNAVMSKAGLTEYFTYMAMMGLNMVRFYMEDVYEIEDYKYFGYMRGRYSRQELKEIDDLADMFGIELSPIIQTLGHMEMYLKNAEAFPVRDTARALLVENEATYTLIDKMFASLKDCFRSNKLNFGMDECWNIGRGEYLHHYRGGVVDSGRLYFEHMKKVVEIGLKYDYDLRMFGGAIPLMTEPEWYEDFENFKYVTVETGLYDGNLSDEELDKIANLYPALGAKFNIIGGLQTWRGFVPETYIGLDNAKGIMDYAIKRGIKEVFGTIWVDGGAEINHILTLPIVQVYAEKMYCKNATEEQVKENFEFITGTCFQAFKDMAGFHNLNQGGNLRESSEKYIGKRLIYNDVLCGLSDYYLFEDDYVSHYAALKEKFTAYKNRNDAFKLHYAVVEALFDVLTDKCYVASKLKKAYDADDREFLSEVANKILPCLKEKVEVLRKLHRTQWMSTRKAFGYELLDIRYGAIANRCDTGSYRINSYLNGEIGAIEELAEPRLPYATVWDIEWESMASNCIHPYAAI